MIDYYLEAYTHTIRKARKEHRCLECLGIINKGESYHYESGVGEGQGQSFKTCLDCYNLRQEIDSDLSSWDKMAFEQLREYIVEGSVLEHKVRFNDIMVKRKSRYKNLIDINEN